MHDVDRRVFVKLAAQGSLLGLLTASARAADRFEDWSCWRGQTRDGICPDGKWPEDLSGLRKMWSANLWDSYSGPVVSGQKVFTTETIEKRDESLVAFDRNTGEELWRRQWPGAMSVPFFAKANGDWIRSTPATDGRRIVVGGMRDVIACFDTESGAELWRIDFGKQQGSALPSFGLVCSPLLDGRSVYVQAGGAVRKIDLETGDFVWDSMPESGGMSGGAFSSPMISMIHGTRQLIVQTRTTLCGLELEKGRPLWQRDIKAFRGMNILTPTVWRNQVFTSAYGGQAQLINIRPDWSTDVTWESRAEAYMSSPVVVDDHLYLHLRNKRFCCLNLSTGDETWRTTPFGAYWSLISDGEKILALDESGELLLINANPSKFELIERRQISEEPSWAHLAVAGNQIFIRRQRGLDAYQWG